MAPLEGAFGDFQITKSLNGSLVIALSRFDPVGEDVGVAALTVFGFLDEARVIGVRPGRDHGLAQPPRSRPARARRTD